MSRDEWPVRAIVAISKAVGEEMTGLIADHERRLHEHAALPPRRTAAITAAPFANRSVPDDQVVRAIELMAGEQNMSLEQAALILDVPALLLERAIADYRPPYRRWLAGRASA